MKTKWPLDFFCYMVEQTNKIVIDLRELERIVDLRDIS